MERCRRGGVPTSAKTAIGQPKTIPLAVLPPDRRSGSENWAAHFMSRLEKPATDQTLSPLPASSCSTALPDEQGLRGANSHKQRFPRMRARQ